MCKNVRKLLSLVLVLILALPLMPASALAAARAPVIVSVTASDGSGSLSVPKLSKQEIVDLLRSAPTEMPSDVFEEMPSCSAPYSTGKVRTEVLSAAAARLNALRQIAGLPAVQLDAPLCQQAQYGAVILGQLGTLSHRPGQPADMDDAFYKSAYEATSSSNLFGGVDLLSTPDGFMDDSDASNVDRLGHRRWQLNPALGKVGFGYVDNGNGYRRFTAEKVFDRSGKTSDYDYVAWPASGNFPSNLQCFTSSTAWSVSLNPSRYQTPSASSVTVTLTRQSDGKAWTFSGQNSYQPSSSGLYFNVDTGGYGISNCIIFRPDGIGTYEGVYSVTINGLKDTAGNAASLAYQVDFFNTESLPPTPQEPARPVAIPTNDSLLVNGVPAVAAAYKIDGANYFKLRDVAALLSGSPKQFDVDYDDASRAVTIATGAAYTPEPGDLAGVPASSQPYYDSNDSILIDGRQAKLTVYKIGGANYFKLRDLGAALDFNVGWDDAGRTMYIEGDKPYDPNN